MQTQSLSIFQASKILSTNAAIALICGLSLNLVGCDKSTSTTQAKNHTQSASTKHENDNQDILTGCYTVSHSEPAQIKITKSADTYAMQMHKFNDPTKNWDTPEPMQVLDNHDAEVQKYFDIKADERKYIEKVIARPDRVFVLAKITDSFASLNPQFDSPYLGYIYKGSNTIYKVDCEQTKQL